MLGKYGIASIAKQISGGDISSELSEIERKKAAKDAVVAFSTGSKNAESVKVKLIRCANRWTEIYAFGSGSLRHHTQRE